jgi:hypothetical protein
VIREGNTNKPAGTDKDPSVEQISPTATCPSSTEITMKKWGQIISQLVRDGKDNVTIGEILCLVSDSDKFAMDLVHLEEVVSLQSLMKYVGMENWKTSEALPVSVPVSAPVGVGHSETLLSCPTIDNSIEVESKVFEKYNSSVVENEIFEQNLLDLGTNEGAASTMEKMSYKPSPVQQRLIYSELPTVKLRHSREYAFENREDCKTWV